jgi:hypothetical protein
MPPGNKPIPNRISPDRIPVTPAKVVQARPVRDALPRAPRPIVDTPRPVSIKKAPTGTPYNSDRELDIEERRLIAAQAQAESLGIDLPYYEGAEVPTGSAGATGTDKTYVWGSDPAAYNASGFGKEAYGPYFKEVGEDFFVTFDDPITGGVVRYNPETGIFPLRPEYGPAITWMENLLDSPLVPTSSKIAITKYLAEKKKDKGGVKLSGSQLGLPSTGERSIATQSILNPIKGIGILGRSLIAGGSEVAKAIPGVEGSPSYQGLKEKLVDEKYGFGSEVSPFPNDTTWGKWANRTLGLAGDIILDPTNLVFPTGGLIANVAADGARVAVSRGVARLFEKEADNLLSKVDEAALIKFGVPQVAVDRLKTTAANLFGVSDDIAQSVGVNKPFASMGNVVNAGTKTLSDDILQTAQKAFDDAAIEVSKYVNITGKTARKPVISAGKSKATRIIEADDVRILSFGAKKTAEEALNAALASGDSVAISAARKAFEAADQTLARNIEATRSLGYVQKGSLMPRKYGETSRVSLAQSIKEIRAAAIRDAANLTLSDASRAAAKAVVETLTDDVIGDIATRGYAAVRGQVAEALGSKSGFRVGTNRLFGGRSIAVGRQARTSGTLGSTGTTVVSELIGNTASKTRMKLTRFVGDKFMKAITPNVRSGPFDPEMILKMRTALRNGSVKGAEAVNYLNVIGLNDAIIRARASAMTNANKLFNRALRYVDPDTGRSVMIDSKFGKSLIPFLSVDESDWALRGLVPTRQQAQAVYKVREVLGDAWEEANNLHKALGNTEDLPFLEGYFPLTQTKMFTDWAARNAEDALAIGQEIDIKVIDPTWITSNFMERTLKEGSSFFGRKLTADDLANGPSRLNQIARESGRLGKRNINVFEEEFVPILGNYFKKHASYMSFGEAVLKAVSPLSPYLDTFRKIGTGLPVTPANIKKLYQDITDLEDSFKIYLSPERLIDFDPADLDELGTKIATLGQQLRGVAGFGNIPVSMQIVSDGIADASRYIDELRALVQSGNYPVGLIPLNIQEAELYVASVLRGIDDIRFTTTQVTPSQWRNAVKIAEDGFDVLNFQTIPDITARREVAEMLTNIQKLGQVETQNAFNATVNAYQSMWKTWTLATPGYVRRNSFGDTFQMLTAGANLEFTKTILRYYKQFIDSGLTLEEFAYKKITNTTERKAFLESMSSIPQNIYRQPSDNVPREIFRRSMTGSSQGLRGGGGGTGEIAGELPIVGFGSTGVTGQPVTGRIPIIGKYGIGGQSKTAAKISAVAGIPPSIVRNWAGIISDAQRVALTYDGLMKGLPLEEAINRTNKYLIDYTSTSAVDDVIKRLVMPFWMFASRNLSMTFEHAMAHPKAYNRYNYIRNSLRERPEDIEEREIQAMRDEGMTETEIEEYMMGTEYQERRRRDAGAFVLDSDVSNIIKNKNLGLALATFAGLGIGEKSGLMSLIPFGLRAMSLGGLGNLSRAPEGPLGLNLDLAFPGGGRPNELGLIPQEILSLFRFADKPNSTILASLPAPIRVLLEGAFEKKLYTRNDLVSAYNDLPPAQQVQLYYLVQTVPQLSWLGKIPAIRQKVDLYQNDFLAGVLGVPLSFSNVDEDSPVYRDSLDRIIADKAVNQGASFVGSPFYGITTSSQIAEAARRRRVYEDLIAAEEEDNARGNG